MKKAFLFIVMISFAMISCTEDNRTLGFANPKCVICGGTGYVKKTEYLIFTTYNDCPCKSFKKSLKDIYYDGGSNPSFKGSESSRKKGKKCHYIEYGSGSIRECWDRGKCSGFSPQHWDAYTCSKCKHSIDYHY